MEELLEARARAVGRETVNGIPILRSHYQATNSEERLFAPVFKTIMIVLARPSNLTASQLSCHRVL
jgi:hypothetical protein